jgi:hypothetical protein
MNNDYLKAKSIFDGKSLDEVLSIVKNDKRMSFGASKGEDNIVDINFGSVLVTWREGHISEYYEEYDLDGNFMGVCKC